MDEQRLDPDQLLTRIKGEKPKESRGRLKIFFGYAAGVGKTYAMLEAAHAAKDAGVDVVAGYIEPHTRPATLGLLDGIERLPPLTLSYKGVALREFDLDGAIARRPQLILVDELAHTNAEGCRHRKRYQDIEELLKAGVDVYTTVNVQHIESLNDIVASITGVIVRERVPDSVFDSADQVKLVDIEPDDLIERLSEGKIYASDQAHRALGHFFTRENLVALREIALRRTADRVNRIAERGKPLGADYYTEEHILICLSSSPSNAKVIRTAARMAGAFHGSFTALFVETPGTAELDGENRGRLRENLRLAEQLGAHIATVYGEDIPAQIAEYAKVSGVSKIVIGRSNNRKGLFARRQNLVERLTVLAPNIDIHIIPDNAPPYTAARRWRKLSAGAFGCGHPQDRRDPRGRLPDFHALFPLELPRGEHYHRLYPRRALRRDVHPQQDLRRGRLAAQRARLQLPVYGPLSHLPLQRPRLLRHLRRHVHGLLPDQHADDAGSQPGAAGRDEGLPHRGPFGNEPKAPARRDRTGGV